MNLPKFTRCVNVSHTLIISALVGEAFYITFHHARTSGSGHEEYEVNHPDSMHNAEEDINSLFQPFGQLPISCDHFSLLSNINLFIAEPIGRQKKPSNWTENGFACCRLF